MKILILLNHSHDNRGLAQITQANTWKYTAKYGYDVIWLRLPWPEARIAMLERLQALLPLYDAVVTIGSDVLFMNHGITIESLLQENDDVIMALEQLGESFGYSPDGYSPINNDVMIWRNTPRAAELLEELISHYPIWREYRLLWQQYLAKAFLDNGGKITGVRFIEPRVMNACPHSCSGQWQPGDFILHLLALSYDQKRALALHFLPQVLE